MVKSKIIQVHPSTPVTLVAWRRVETTRGPKEKMIKVTPRKKACHSVPKHNITPSRAGPTSIDQPIFFPDDDGYPYMDDDPPPRKFQGLKNQVQL